MHLRPSHRGSPRWLSWAARTFRPSGRVGRFGLQRAADRGDFLLRDLSHPNLAEACGLVNETVQVQGATAVFDRATHYTADAGLAVEMGRRALVRAIVNGGNAKVFAAELFAETVSYYASRDLPSFVAAPGRISNVTAAIQLKENFRNIARNAAFETGDPPSDPKGWRRYVASVLSILQRPEVQK